MKADTDFDGIVWLERILHGTYTGVDCGTMLRARDALLLMVGRRLTSYRRRPDTMSVLNQPEWPVASLFLERFLLMLKSDRGLGGSVTAMRQVGHLTSRPSDSSWSYLLLA